MYYLTLILVLFSTLGHALECGDFERWVRALYWTPTTAPLAYLQVNTLLSNGSRFPESFMASFDHNWGVEVGGGLYQCGGSILKLRGLWIRNSRSFFKRIDILPNQQSSGLSLPSFGVFLPNPTGTTSSHIHSQYWTIRLTFDQNFYSGSCLSFTSSVGGRYVNLSQSLSTNGEFFSPATQTQQSKGVLNQSYNGGGFEASIRGKWDLEWSLALSGEVGVSAIVGASKTRVNVSTINTNEARRIFRRVPSLTRIVPGLDASLDLAFNTCAWGVHWTSSVGYTIQHYFSTYSQLNNSRKTNYIDSGYGGPYLSLGTKF